MDDEEWAEFLRGELVAALVEARQLAKKLGIDFDAELARIRERREGF